MRFFSLIKRQKVSPYTPDECIPVCEYWFPLFLYNVTVHRHNHQWCLFTNKGTKVLKWEVLIEYSNHTCVATQKIFDFTSISNPENTWRLWAEVCGVFFLSFSLSAQCLLPLVRTRLMYENAAGQCLPSFPAAWIIYSCMGTPLCILPTTLDCS